MPGLRPLFLLFLLPAVAAAQEPSGLEQAKQDLKVLPTLRKESERPELRLPDLAAPTPAMDLPAPLTPAGRPAAGLDEDNKQKSSRNWLVDAVMKGDDRRTDRTGRSDKGQRDEAEALDGNGGLLERDPHRELAREKEPLHAARDGESTLAAVNPLEPFMADWISKRDHAVLLPAIPPSQGLGGTHTPPGGGPDQAVTIIFRGIDGRADPIGGPLPQRAAPNPFLEALQAPSIPPPAAAPPPPLPGEGDRAPLLRPPETTRETRSQPPLDLSKPPDDKKYFPQLKRF